MTFMRKFMSIINESAEAQVDECDKVEETEEVEEGRIHYSDGEYDEEPAAKKESPSLAQAFWNFYGRDPESPEELERFEKHHENEKLAESVGLKRSSALAYRS